MPKFLKKPWIICLLASQAIASGGGKPKPPIVPTPAPAPTPTPVPEVPKMWGITFDDISNLGAITSTLSALPKTPFSRIVFDASEGPATYQQAVPAIRKVSGVMGELLDSSDVAAMSLSNYTTRAKAYLKAFGPLVDIWEVGNEINGQWLGAGAIDKAAQAFDIILAAPARTALTLYYEKGCEDANGDMLAWAAANVPQRMKVGLTYVLISYYEDQCNGRRPSLSEWNDVFAKLGVIFPNSTLGFGEVGTSKPDFPLAKMQDIMSYYYTLPVGHPRYIGGFFWWNGAENLVPKTQPLFSTLLKVMK